MNEVDTNSKVNGGWYMYYTGKRASEVAMVRIAASCLGDAITTAKSLAQQCTLGLVGVAPDLGVEED